MLIYQDPFEFGRIEQEQAPIIYVPDLALEWLSSRSLRFEGPRGSGKSSFLNAFRWELPWGTPTMLRVHCSPELHDRLVMNPDHLGIYSRFEEMDMPYWTRWASQVGESLATKFFGTYLEYFLIYQLMNAMHGIRKKTGTQFTARNSEIRLVDSILHRIFPRSEGRPHLIESSFSALRDLILDLQFGLRDFVYRESSREEVVKTYPIISPGDLVGGFGEEFVQVYPEHRYWLIMVLLDDCNLLSDWQAKVINTAIAKAGKPICYKLSSVSNLYPTTQTLDPQRPLTDHDIRTIRLPSELFYAGGQLRLDKTYSEIANEVCKLRLDKYYGPKIAQAFDLRQVLGKFELESALLERLAVSEKTDEVKALVGSLSGKTPRVTAKWLSANNIRPGLEETPKDPEAKKKADRRLASKYFKKWNIAAGVAVMREFNLSFPYWGLPIILGLASGSIREVLRIMSGIWQMAKQRPDKFVSCHPINHKIQLRGAAFAARKFLKSLDTRPLSENGPSLQEICIRLGHLFRQCQGPRYMKTAPETASIRIRGGDIDTETAGIIRQGLTAGALLMKNHESSGTVEIAVHPIMAPHFGLSYRNPFYYAEPMSARQLKALVVGFLKEWRRTERQILTERLARASLTDAPKKSTPKKHQTFEDRQGRLFD